MITFVSAFYILKSKFAPEKYIEWITYLLSNIKIFNLVIFCDKNTHPFLEKVLPKNAHIKLIILEKESFYNYKYRKFWERNHKHNHSLNHLEGMCATCWELNMLWSEKISFVKNAYENKYFPETEWYSWMDIGYFRPESRGTLSATQIHQWPNRDKIAQLDDSKIYYALVNNNVQYMNHLYKRILIKNEKGLPVNPIPPKQISIAGGFFLCHKKNIHWWHTVYDKKLKLYFENNYLVKDDQIIIVDCIFSNLNKFSLEIEKSGYDNWFMFQRYLL